MADFLFAPETPPTVAIAGETALYPVRRIFCVGRNYAAHAAEMGNQVDRSAPFYFTKSPHGMAPNGSALAYPPGTADLHHEMELAVALGRPVFKANREDCGDAVLAYGCALDMTRRDLQAQAKEKRRPWDVAKDFEGSAILAPMTRAAEFGDIGAQRIWLDVNGTRRQDAVLSDMIHDVPAVISDLSGYYHLGPGDIILTGTPAGVGAVGPGDVIEGGIGGLAPVSLSLKEPEG